MCTWRHAATLMLLLACCGAPRCQATRATNANKKVPSSPLKYPVWWFGPIWSGTGYSSEAINYVLSTLRSNTLRPTDIWAAHHGDIDRTEVRDAMSEDDRRELRQLESHVNRSRPAIVVCHSLPTNWMLPSPMGWAGAKCPPDPREYAYVYLIGRTMFETDRLPASFVPRCNAMNEVWVPSEFSRQVFIASGVHAHKLRVVPEGINTTYYDPDAHTPMPMPQGDLVFGKAREAAAYTAPSTSGADDAGGDSPMATVTALASSLVGGSTVAAAVGKAMKDGVDVARHQLLQQPPSHADSDLAHRRHGAGGHGQPGPHSSGGSHSHTGKGASGRLPAPPPRQPGAQKQGPFRFLSTFKWEGRKGWDVLLDAYLSEFTAQDDVELVIITKPFMGKSDFAAQMQAWAEKRARERHAAARANVPATPPGSPPTLLHPQLPGAAGVRLQGEGRAATSDDSPSAPPPPVIPGEPAPQHNEQNPKQPSDFEFDPAALPRLYVVHHHIADADLPRYYKAVDAFVLPSRGEGWGRPHVEAMSMGLPVIATNWSGITAYLDERVGYPIKVERLVPADASVWWFRGLQWAQPSVNHLRTLMRQVYTHREEARTKGAAGRQLMVSKFGPEAIGKLIAEEIQRVNQVIPE